MNPIGIALGIKFVNGKIKPSFKSAIGVIIVFCIILLIFAALLVMGIIDKNIEELAAGIIGILSFGYLFAISPYLQNSNDYYMEFIDENTLSGFKLYYKKKLVIVNYRVANDGRIAFADNANKTNCVSYADGSKMSGTTKYKIVNYLSRWLSENKLLSDEVTVSFEK